MATSKWVTCFCILHASSLGFTSYYFSIKTDFNLFSLRFRTNLNLDWDVAISFQAHSCTTAAKKKKEVEKALLYSRSSHQSVSCDMQVRAPGFMMSPTAEEKEQKNRPTRSRGPSGAAAARVIGIMHPANGEEGLEQWLQRENPRTTKPPAVSLPVTVNIIIVI